MVRVRVRFLGLGSVYGLELVGDRVWVRVRVSAKSVRVRVSASARVRVRVPAFPAV